MPVDTGLPGQGAVEVGTDPDMMAGGGADLTITVSSGTVTCNGEPCEPMEALKQLVNAIKQAPEGDDEAAFQSGYGQSAPAMNRGKGNGPSSTTDGGGL